MKKGLYSAALLFALSVPAHAVDVGLTGSGLAFNNMQPSLAINYAIPLTGIYPTSGSGTVAGNTLGFVYQFAGNFAPGNTLLARGDVLSIAQNPALFSLFGTTYGGNGTSTFGLPNLTGAAVMGIKSGEGLSAAPLGTLIGSSQTTLNLQNLPEHNHSLSSGGVSGNTGGGQAFSNLQRSMPLRQLIAASGPYPAGFSAFVGQIATFAGGSPVPAGWLEADGRLMSIVDNTELFSVFGTTYGGNGTSTFALPDLRGRLTVGADTSNPVGSRFGLETNTLAVGQLPAHSHVESEGTPTGSTGGGQSVNNIQPSLAVNYLIATNGIYPGREGYSFDETAPVLGQITQFLGNYAPSGWAIADGSLLPIAQNTALFSLLGTTYGGDGIYSFRLPDFRGRTAIGAGVDFNLGDIFGTAMTTLGISNLPAHAHSEPDRNPVPAPASLALLLLGLAGIGAMRRRN